MPAGPQIVRWLVGRKAGAKNGRPWMWSAWVCVISRCALTGSERAGAAVAEVAGRNLKKVVLELGGSDPFVVLGTDDMNATVEAALAARLGNTGQACNAGKRMIVVADLYDEFVEKFTAKMMEFGSAPLSSRLAADRLQEQVAAQRELTDPQHHVVEHRRIVLRHPGGRMHHDLVDQQQHAHGRHQRRERIRKRDEMEAGEVHQPADNPAGEKRAEEHEPGRSGGNDLNDQ